MPRKPAEYRLSASARRDLEAIWRYTAETWSAEQARRYTGALTRVMSALAGTPNLGTACDHIRPGYRRRRIEEHVIYFGATTYGVAIIRILHNRMDAPRHF